MDVRRKSFVAETTSRLAFLCDDHGFVGPEVTEPDEYPLLIRVRYHRADFDVEESLVLSYGGEEYVAATVIYPGRGPAQRTEIATGTAHTGFQMRRALNQQAAAVRNFLPH